MSSPETTPPAEYPAPPPPTVVAPAPCPRSAPPEVAGGGAAAVPGAAGLGQVYNGHFSKAIFFFFALHGLDLPRSRKATRSPSPLPALHHLLEHDRCLPQRDAHQCARHGGAVEEDDVESPGWGIGLAVVGCSSS
jgi:hypothetical protein